METLLADEIPGCDTISVVGATQARARIAPFVRRTPLITAGTVHGDVHLKCENLQVTQSFKVRGAVSGLLGYREDSPAVWAHIQQHGVVTCSTGNFAQGLAYASARLGIAYAVVVPDAAAPAKLARILRYNPAAQIIKVPYDRWRQTMVASAYPALPGFFLSSECDPYVSSGIATIGLEVLEQLPDLDALLVPYGGGNLAYSLGALLRAAGRAVSVFAVELSTGAPLGASLRAGRPVDVPYQASFVDGIGASFVIPSQFERVRGLLAGVFTVTPDEVAEAVATLLFSHNIVCEGAGAAAFAAALKFGASAAWTMPCAVVSGGVIDPDVLLATVAPSAGDLRARAKLAAAFPRQPAH